MIVENRDRTHSLLMLPATFVFLRDRHSLKTERNSSLNQNAYLEQDIDIIELITDSSATACPEQCSQANNTHQ